LNLLLKYKYLPVIFFLALMFSLLFSDCTSTTVKEARDEKIIASLGEDNLYDSDFRKLSLFVQERKDSAAMAVKIIENWAMEQLFYTEALTKLEESELDIEKQVEDYRKQLVNYIYETKLIENNLDTTVSYQEIEDYYNTYIDNFILKDNIIKVNYFKIPVQSKEIPKIKKLLNATSPKERQELDVLCMQHAESYFTNDSMWLFLDEIKREIPQIKDQIEFNVFKGRVLEFSDSEHYYYLKIKDVKLKNSVSPLAFEKANIKTFIINSRKIKLIESYKQQILEKAKSEKAFKIF
jgi:hypothetical protein